MKETIAFVCQRYGLEVNGRRRVTLPPVGRKVDQYVPGRGLYHMRR